MTSNGFWVGILKGTEMEPRYRDSRVARNSALSTRYLAAFAAICLVSTIVLSIGALMLSTFSDDEIARAVFICLDVCFLYISLAITGVIVDMLQLWGPICFSVGADWQCTPLHHRAFIYHRGAHWAAHSNIVVGEHQGFLAIHLQQICMQH